MNHQKECRYCQCTDNWACAWPTENQHQPTPDNPTTRISITCCSSFTDDTCSCCIDALTDDLTNGTRTHVTLGPPTDDGITFRVHPTEAATLIRDFAALADPDGLDHPVTVIADPNCQPGTIHGERNHPTDPDDDTPTPETLATP